MRITLFRSSMRARAEPIRTDTGRNTRTRLMRFSPEEIWADSLTSTAATLRWEDQQNPKSSHHKNFQATKRHDECLKLRICSSGTARNTTTSAKERSGKLVSVSMPLIVAVLIIYGVPALFTDIDALLITIVLACVRTCRLRTAFGSYFRL